MACSVDDLAADSRELMDEDELQQSDVERSSW